MKILPVIAENGHVKLKIKLLNSKKKQYPQTLGELKKQGFHRRTVKDELRENLIKKLQNNEKIFPGIEGFDDTVIPDLQRAILSRHNILLLGLRGQAKTSIARLMVNLLDEYIPVVKGSEINDDPFDPQSFYAKDKIEQEGDNTEIAWMPRDQRFTEKLATPDVTVADLIGDADPIKAATLKLPYSDERVIHYGLVPRANRGIFTINELPDLQARIQVALFNILQEGDIQIRGFTLRMPLDIQFIFTANPEDYTNRGAIVTPLKDRIDSQILTHYPRDIATSGKITRSQASTDDEQKHAITIDPLMADLIEQVAFEARVSEYIDPKSGVSARLTISAYENLYSAAERRSLINNEKTTSSRLSDLQGIIPAITGKIELVYEGEQEGPVNVAHHLLGKAIRTQFPQYFSNPEKLQRDPAANPFKNIVGWFEKGNSIELHSDMSTEQYKRELDKVTGLKEIVQKHQGDIEVSKQYLLMEFLLHGLAEFSMLSKDILTNGHSFKDIVSGMLSKGYPEDEEDFDEQDDF